MDLIEEGIHLLRRAPAWSWCAYFLGAGPFLLAFLYFWNDMAYSGLAPQRLLSASFVLALLYVWMRFCEVAQMRGLWAVIRNEPAEGWTLNRGLDAFFAQAQWQTTALLTMPICLVLTVPFAHAFSLYQNLIILEASDRPGDEDDSRLGRASRLAGVWNGQAWSLLGILGVVAFMLLLNWYTVILFAPQLLKSLLGIDSIIIRSSYYNLNSTTFSIALGLTYLAMEPLIKASFLLRCHYAQSRQSGDDLLFAARRLRAKASRGLARATGLAVIVAALGFLAPDARAEDSGGRATPEQLDDSIDDTLSKPEYIWRFPKEEVAENMETPQWWEDFWESVRTTIETIGKWIDDLFSNDKPKETNPPPSFWGDLSLGTAIAYVLIALAVLALIWGAFKLWASRLPSPAPVQAAPAVEAVPDLTSEDLTADVLPRNRWLELAQSLIAEGNFRLALRALFLAELAHLADEGLIALSRFKSNLDYKRELARRGGSTPEILRAYGDSALLFDGVWYGEKPAGEPEIERMKSCLHNVGLAW